MQDYQDYVVGEAQLTSKQSIETNGEGDTVTLLSPYSEAKMNGEGCYGVATRHSSNVTTYAKASCAIVRETAKAETFGDSSIALATGKHATVSVNGNNSVAVTLGEDGAVKATVIGTPIIMRYWHESKRAWRIAVAYVGEKGIKPDVWYEVDAKGKFRELK